MPRIDFYLSSMERFSAAGIVLTSGAKVVLKFPAGDRVSAQTTAHDDVISLVEEVAPIAVITGLRNGAKKSFIYDMKGKQFVVEVKRSSAPTVGKGFWNACEDVGSAGGIVVYNGNDDIPLGDGVRALGLRDAIAWVRERI